MKTNLMQLTKSQYNGSLIYSLTLSVTGRTYLKTNRLKLKRKLITHKNINSIKKIFAVLPLQMASYLEIPIGGHGHEHKKYGWKCNKNSIKRS